MKGRLFAHSDFATVPLAIGTICAPRLVLAVVEFGLGIVAWTLIEYGVHRALHDRRLPRLKALHMRHHQHPQAPSGGTLWSSLIILALVVVALVGPATTPAILGLLAGYLGFILLHHGEHHGWALERVPPAAIGALAEHHRRHHHALPRGCFGVTTTAWDRLFGTL